MKRIIIAIIIVIAAIVVVLLTAFGRTPESCTPGYLKTLFDSSAHPYSVSFDGSEKTQDASAQALSDVLQFDEWNKIKEPSPKGSELIRIRISEDYEITVYENCIHAHDGYSRVTEKNDVYYSVPEKSPEKVEYIAGAMSLRYRDTNEKLSAKTPEELLEYLQYAGLVIPEGCDVPEANLKMVSHYVQELENDPNWGYEGSMIWYHMLALRVKVIVDRYYGYDDIAQQAQDMLDELARH